MIAVGGGGWPVGQASRKEPAGIPPAATTLKLTEIAPAPDGMPQIPQTVQFRASLLAKIPPWIGAPLPRVSTIRHGLTAMKGRGGVSESVVAPRALGGVHEAGAGQFAMVSAPRARLPRKNEVMARDERLV